MFNLLICTLSVSSSFVPPMSRTAGQARRLLEEKVEKVSQQLAQVPERRTLLEAPAPDMGSGVFSLSLSPSRNTSFYFQNKSYASGVDGEVWEFREVWELRGFIAWTNVVAVDVEQTEMRFGMIWLLWCCDSRCST